jgi:hypothetical protein
MLRGRLLSFGMVLGIGFLLLVSLVLSAALSALGHFWSGWFPGWEVLMQAINFVVGFAVVTGLFAMIYKLLPRCDIGWKDVWIGAMVTSLLFSVGKLLIGLYLGKSGVASGFGAAGSLVIVLLWVYYSSQIFLLGAEFTKTYAYRHCSRVAQAKPAPAGTKPRRSAQGEADTREDAQGTHQRTPPEALVPMYRGEQQPHELVGYALAGFNKLRIAAGVAAALGLLAGEVLSEMRARRPIRRGWRS